MCFVALDKVIRMPKSPWAIAQDGGVQLARDEIEALLTRRLDPVICGEAQAI
jgi:hypothetical protein